VKVEGAARDGFSLLDERVSTPTLELRGATDELLEQLADAVRAGKTNADPAPYDDPISFCEPDSDLRVAKWLWRSTASGRTKQKATPGLNDALLSACQDAWQVSSA
jgi:hypothetical protein